MERLNQSLKNSELLKQNTSRIHYNAFTAIAVYFGLWLVGLGLGRLFAQLMFNVFALNANGNEPLALRKLIVCGTQILLFFVWVTFVEKQPIQSVGFRGKHPFRRYMTGFILGVGTISIVVFILLAAKMITMEYDTPTSNDVILHFAMIAVGWMIQSASEEIAIRGWLIPRLAKRCSPLISIFITALLFGVLHLFSAGVTVLSFLNLILSGVFFASYAIKDGNIWGVCGLHFAWNFALANIYGLPVSGFAENGIKLFRTQQIGSSIFTGGDFGPEGGLVTAIILLLAIAVLMMNWRKNEMTDH